MKNPISPKLPAGGVWAGFATLALALLANITPGQLAFLGPEAPLAYGVVIGGAFALGVYRKEDPLRAAGLAARQVAADPGLAAKLPAGLLDVLQSVEGPAPAGTFPAGRVAAAAPAAAPAAPAADPAPTAAPAADPVPTAAADPQPAPAVDVPPATVTPLYQPPSGTA